MKKILSFILVCALLLGCAAPPQILAAETETDGPEFQRLDDPDLLRYVQDNVYNELVTTLDSDEYFVENVNAVYVSNEYLEELAFNSQSNIFFGYSLEELDEQFQGTRYVFTLGEDGGTGVEPFEAYDDTYEHVIKNVAKGTGVILLCATVSTVSAGGAPAVSMIFAASAKTGTAFALSSGALGVVSAGVVKGIQTGDFDEAVKAGALAGSETFKWGAISGAIGGGTSEAIGLRGAALTNNLTMNQAAAIQRESKYPLDVIRQFQNTDQYQIFKNAGLKSQIIDNKTALIRNIDLNYMGKDGTTNLEKMTKGQSPLDPEGNPYELHHIGQKQDSTLAILTKAEHMQNGNNKILHPAKGPSQVDHEAFAKQRESFWQDLAELLMKEDNLIKTDFVKMVHTLEYFCSSKGVDMEAVQLAEQTLGLRFAEEYREYLTTFGTASANGHELTGLGVSRRLDVTAVTKEEREKNPAVPGDFYVVEQVNIDDIVAWQSASGEIFLTTGQSKPVKTADSLIQYMAEIE